MVAAICDSAHYAMYQALKPGVREREIKGIGTEVLYRLGADSIWSILVSAGGMIGGLSMDSDKIIQPGDFVTIDIVRATYLGYTSCIYRNYAMCVPPTQKQKDLHKASYDRMYKVIDAIKPGMSTADLAQHWIPAKNKGFPSEEYMWCDDLAHGLGLWLYEYPIINRLWSLKYPMTIEKNMTMAIEAMEFDPLVGRTKLEEMGVVTDDGFEIFTKMPVEDIMIASPIFTVKTDAIL
jgi:Xaa-Pro dipeptidase